MRFYFWPRKILYMRKSVFNSLLTLCMLTVSAIAGAQVTIAGWTFNGYSNGTIVNNPPANTGVHAGTASAQGVNNPATVNLLMRNGSSNGCNELSGNSAWNIEMFDPGTVGSPKGLEFGVSTAGYEDVSFSWDQRWSNTAPNTVRLMYTLNGSTWTSFTMTNANTTLGCTNGNVTAWGNFEVTAGEQFKRITVDMSSIAGANNNPNFKVRLLAAAYQNTGQFRRASSPGTVADASGTWRVDNVNFRATLTPGPNPSVISGTTSICSGETAEIRVDMTDGIGPFRLVLHNGTSNFTVSNYVSGTPITVGPLSANQTYTIVSVHNLNSTAYGVGTNNSGSAVITVTPSPTVSATNITSCASGAVTLSGGLPAGGTYSIPNPYSGPTTTFTYTYTDPVTGCSRTSPVRNFTRNTAPSITTEPSTAGQSVCQGEPFTPITVAADGTGPLQYQWYSNVNPSVTGGIPLTSGAHISNGSKTTSYTPLSTVVGTLYYYVVVTGPAGCSFARSAAPTGAFVVSAPTIAGSISPSQTICAGYAPAGISLSGNNGVVEKWQTADDAAFTTNVQDLAITATALTGADLGPLTSTIFVRAVVKNGGCPSVETAPVQLEVRSTTWNGSWSNGLPDSNTSVVFEDDFTSTGNIAACSAVVTSGDVVFNSGDVLTLQDGLTVSGGTLTFEDTASLVQINDATNSGFISYKRNTTPIRKFDFTYWSSPVEFQILASLSPLTLSDKYFWWDPAIYNWANITAPGISPMEVGKGYIIRGPQNYSTTTPAIYTGTFTGTPNNGEQTVDIFVNGANDLNLIGNPYPSTLDADLFMSDPENAAALGTGTSLYFWTHNTPITNLEYSFSDYAVYNYTGGTGTQGAAGANNSIPDGNIAAGQGFFVKGIATGTAKFKNSMRKGTENDRFYRQAPAQKSRFWLELSNDLNAFKQTLIGYVDGASDEFDTGFDAPLTNGTNPVQLYSRLNAEKLSIQGFAPDFNTNDVIPIGFSVTSAGTYQISLSRFDGLFQNQDVLLRDNLTGTTHDLKASAYVFTTMAGADENRFDVVFTSNALLETPESLADSGAVVYHNAGNLFVTSKVRPIQKAELFDMAGRKLGVRENNGNADTLFFGNEYANQPLVVTITFADGGRQQAKVVY